jgi:hypothetical protein
MATDVPAADPKTATPYPTRFGWGMRLFLAVLLFDMIFRSFSVMWPWGDWAKDLDMQTMPRRLPTRAELAELPLESSVDNPAPLQEEVMLTLDSVWVYFKPWPEPQTRARLHTWNDSGRWALAWMTTRLEFIENVIGINEEWPMFSPSVGRRKWLARARLVYADGSEEIVRGKCDPEDLTNYSHWWEEKVLDHELKVREGGESKARDSFGYCNLLSHRYSRNASGSELRRIYLYLVRYDLPPPGVDARQWLKEQTGPPSEQQYQPFYSFDVSTRKGTILIEQYD